MHLILFHVSPNNTRSELRESNRSFRKYSVPEIIHRCQESYTFLPPFTFAILFPVGKQACGPEARALRGKSIGGKSIPPGDPPCFRRARRAHRAPSHALRVTPLRRNIPVFGKRKACPPGPENEARLMIFARNALVSGPGNA